MPREKHRQGRRGLHLYQHRRCGGAALRMREERIDTAVQGGRGPARRNRRLAVPCPGRDREWCDSLRPWRRRANRRGQRHADAAHARAIGATIVTANADEFKRVEGPEGRELARLKTTSEEDECALHHEILRWNRLAARDARHVVEHPAHRRLERVGGHRREMRRHHDVVELQAARLSAGSGSIEYTSISRGNWCRSRIPREIGHRSRRCGVLLCPHEASRLNLATRIRWSGM